MPLRPAVVRHSHVGKPHALNSILEPRALLEMALLPASLPLLLQAPRGDGHPVLLLPGFLADEKSLIALKLFLAEQGLRSAHLGAGAQCRFSQQACQCLAAENSTPSPCHRTQGQPGRLESGRRVFTVWRREQSGMRAFDHHAGQSRSASMPAAASRLRRSGRFTDWCPIALALPHMSCNLAPRLCAKSTVGDSHQLPVLVGRRRGAAAGSHHRRRPGHARKHSSSRQPSWPRLQRNRTGHRRRPTGAAGGGVAAVSAKGTARARLGHDHKLGAGLAKRTSPDALPTAGTATRRES